MLLVRQSPGACPICGAAHTACRADTGPISVVMLPHRDAAPVDIAPVPLVAERVQAGLPAGQVTTGTYRRAKR